MCASSMNRVSAPTLTSNLFLSGQYDSAQLHGEVNVEQLSFTRRIST